jgi:hypothetical protein
MAKRPAQQKPAETKCKPPLPEALPDWTAGLSSDAVAYFETKGTIGNRRLVDWHQHGLDAGEPRYGRTVDWAYTVNGVRHVLLPADPTPGAFLSDDPRCVVETNNHICHVTEDYRKWCEGWQDGLPLPYVVACRNNSTLASVLRNKWTVYARAHAFSGKGPEHGEPVSWWERNPDGTGKMIPFFDCLASEPLAISMKYLEMNVTELEWKWEDAKAQTGLTLPPIPTREVYDSLEDDDAFAWFHAVALFVDFYESGLVGPQAAPIPEYVRRRMVRHGIRLVAIDSPTTGEEKVPMLTRRWADLTFRFDADMLKADVLDRNGTETGHTVSRGSLGVGPKDWETLTMIAQGGGDVRAKARAMAPIQDSARQAMGRLNKALRNTFGMNSNGIEGGKFLFRVELQETLDRGNELQRLIAAQAQDRCEDPSATLADGGEDADN